MTVGLPDSPTIGSPDTKPGPPLPVVSIGGAPGADGEPDGGSGNVVAPLDGPPSTVAGSDAGCLLIPASIEPPLDGTSGIVARPLAE